ncbi:MAG TPA: Asp23/Gls24 family envelope stress response protein [bacterium]|nr:Asp23/Gls24 family envelope stress response protein [bacterium]HOL47306.1 Asp23/Gls24 family envelope stress response protein [bacterium]HPQ17643.1 Asp23/Gls24 family envelope stress response protein [bacterium]
MINYSYFLNFIKKNIKSNKILSKLYYYYISYYKKIYGITTYGLVGRSGSGKSHNAYIVAYQLKTNAIIDDGLLIVNGKIICGKSAKRAATKIGAVKRAIFYDIESANEIKYYIKKLKIKKILILATSEKMLNRILSRLDLPPAEKVYRIENIVSKCDLEKAKYYRNIEGKHVLPVSEIEILRRFPDLYVDSFELNIPETQIKIQKSIIRPTFSLPGKIIIQNKVLKFYIYKIIEKNFSNIRVENIQIKKEKEGIRIELKISAKYGLTNLLKLSKKMQIFIKKEFEFFTGLELSEINIKIGDVYYE